MFIGLKMRGVDVEFMTKRNCYYGRRLEACGIPVHDFIPRRKFSWTAIRIIRRVLKEGRHDIVHLFNNKAIVNGIVASLGLPVKVVTYRGRPGNISRRDPTCYLTHLSPRVDRIVCVSDSVRHSLEREVFDASKLITIYKGHDISWYAGTEAADLSALGVPQGAFVVACVANNRPNKGVDVLLAATHELRPDMPIHLLLVGRGMTADAVRSLVDASPMASHIHLSGYRKDVLEIVAACDTTVLPAVKREGLPKTVIESMALGVTPIVTDTGGSAELVRHGECGLVVPPGDPKALARAILELYKNPDVNRRMGAAARQRLATHFPLEASVAAHLRLYSDLAAGLPRPS